MFGGLEQLLRFDDIGTTQYAYLWRQVSSLRDRQNPLVGCNNFNTPNPRKGRVHSIYFLNTNGKRVLENEFGFDSHHIRYKTGKYLTTTQYSHRLISVEYHIQIEKWASNNQSKVLDYIAYYNSKKKTGSSLRTRLNINTEDGASFTPDAAYHIEDKNGNIKFHLFELYNGTDLSFIMRQMKPHLEAFINGSTHRSFGLEKEPYFLDVLFSHKRVMKKFIDQMKQEDKYKSLFDFILVNHTDPMDRMWQENIFNSWVSLSGNVTKF